MALRFKQAVAVAVGTFNIYVIQPKWLMEVKILQEGSRIKMATDLNRPGFQYSQQDSTLKWDVRPDRMVIQSDSPADNCGTTLAKVLDKLPWTPLAGVGANFEFVGEVGELDAVVATCRPPSCDIPEGYVAKQASAHIALERGEQIYNLQLSKTDQLELSINVHTELTKKGSQEDVSRVAIDVCRRFNEFREVATSLASQLLAIEVIYE